MAFYKDGILSYPLDKELAYYGQRKGSATSKKYKLIFDHVTFLMETQALGLFKSIYYTLYWMVNGFFRYMIK